MMDERQKFVIQAAKEREERIALQGAANVVVQLQAAIRGFIARKKFIQCFENDFDIKFGLIYSEQTLVPTNVQLLIYGTLLCRFLKESENIVRYGAFCRQLAQSLFSADEKITFAALLADPIQSNFATTLIRKIHTKVPSILATVDLDKVTHHKSATAIVTYLVLLSSPTLWALTKTKNELGSTMQNCCASYSFGLLEISSLEYLSTFLNNCLKRVKPTQFSDFINNIVTVLHRVVKTCFSNIGVQSTNITIKYLYTCPGLLSLLNKNTIGLVKDAKTFENILKFFNKNSQILDDFSVLQTLNLLANIIFLSNIEHDLLVENVLEWTHVVNSFFTRFQSTLSGNKSKPFAHPVLGFISERIGPNDDSINNIVKDQLQNFWSKKMVSCLFGKVLGSVEGTNTKKLASQGDSLSTDLINRLKKLMVKEQPDYTMNLGPVSLTAVVCQLYQNAILTFQKLHDDIVRGLCFDNSILKQLWTFICTNSPKGPTHYLLSLFSADLTGNLPHFSPFSLFAHTAYSQISSLDEQEMYEEGIPFSIQQLCDIAYFTNVFCFKAIWENILDFEQSKAESLFSSLYKLCMLLHNRDARRSFISDKHFWLAPDLKSSAIISEFEKKTRKGSKLMSMMPHLVNLKERMILFRRLVNLDKKEAEKRNGLTSLVTIGRNSLVEDGYRQLSQMSSEELKAGFRIKFVNQQGLDEAGIDQDGVFKEFLELTVKGIFNPELNLFKMTINGQFYPSNTSNIHENHLEYFYHIGRMLGKAVYDGFVVDIQLAPVLLATILKKRLYALDELAQVDPDMYKNLTYIKKYKESEDVADLELTFSVDEEFLGQVKTVDLPNSGRYMKVTNENRMRYVHEMAIYRVVTRTRAQTESFVLGFRSILNSEWLALFSTHELQSLISGIRTDVDVADLKKNTQYYGGFHSNHRVIKWLWEVVEHEFSAEERGLFLKFVTSCSRAPLLGFSSLEPPFSIRCIETSDDQDPGDTLGSVVRGFLAINKKTKSTARLPTSSTCFNLLKLPNYNKKSLLLEKLRYAIRAQAGFELS